MTLTATTSLPSPNAERVTQDTPAADAVNHHLTVFADGDDAPSFQDFLDIINPLQHIPIVNTIYRNLTDDRPGALARVAGGALFGGVIGMALEAADAVIDDETGKDVGEHVLAFLTGGDDTPGDGKTAVASDTTEPPPTLAQSDKPPEQLVGDADTAPATGLRAIQIASITPDTAPAAASVPTASVPTASDPLPASPKGPKLMASASAVPPTDAAAPTAATAGPGQLPPGFMTLPARRPMPMAPLPPLHAQITNNNERSNMPITGRPKVTSALSRDSTVPPTSPADSATALTAQQVAIQSQPLPPAPASQSANPWFAETMAKALDKYEQMNKLNRASAPPATLQ